MRKKWVIVFVMAVMAAMLAGAGSGFAVNVYWTGDGGDDNWNTNFNWSPNDDGVGVLATRPASTNTVVFNANSDAASLSTTNDLAGLASMIIQVDTPGANVSIANTAGMTIQTINVTATRDLTLTGAANTLVLVPVITVSNAATKVSIANLGGSPSYSKAGLGTLILTGTIIQEGTEEINGGTLLFNGNTGVAAVGAINVFSGATLGGKGSFDRAGNVITIKSGAFLNPGDPADVNGVGTLNTIAAITLDSGSRFIVDVKAAGVSDQLTTSGVTTITAGAIIQLGTVSGVLAQDYTPISGSNIVNHFTINNTGWTQSFSGTYIRLFGNPAVIGVPTFTEWGLILFGLLIAAFAIWSIRKKNYKAA